MPDPHVLYIVTAVVVLGLVVWVALVLALAPKPPHPPPPPAPTQDNLTKTSSAAGDVRPERSDDSSSS